LINFPGKNVRSILEDSEGNLWFGSDGGGVCKYLPEKKMFINYKEADGICSNKIMAILEDKFGIMWFGTNGGGLCKLNHDAFVRLTIKDGLSSNSILSIVQGSKGALWFGTDGKGLTKLDGNNFYTYDYNNGLKSNIILSSLQDRSANIWFGTSGEGLSVLTGKVSALEDQTNQFLHYNVTDGLGSNSVISIAEDKSGNIWLATLGAGISCITQKSLDDKEKFKSGIINLTDQQGLPNNLVVSILEDKNGNIWFGTLQGGVASLPRQKIRKAINGNTKKLKELFGNFTEKQGLSHNSVLAIAENKNGSLFFGTDGGGITIIAREQINLLSKINQGNYQINCKYINKDNGLISDAINLLIADDEYLWAGSAKGLSRILLDKQNDIKTIVNYGREEGFKNISCKQNAVWKEKDGKIWFGTSLGVLSYNSRDDKYKAKEPLLNISKLRLFYEDISWKKYGDIEFQNSSSWYPLPLNLQLPYHQNHLTLHFEAVSTINASKIKYKYMLEGADKSWSPPVKENTATYSNLSPGNYTFKVISTYDGYHWNQQPATYYFTITPPFWQTWWFYVTSVIFLLIIAYGILKYRTRSLEQQKIKLYMLVRQRSKELAVKNKKLGEANKSLQHYADELARSNRELDEFASVVSHDLKEPLRKVSTYSNMIKESLNDKMSEKDISHMDRMLNANDRMRQLIEDLLAFARVATKKNPYEPTDLKTIVNEVLSDLEIRIMETKGKVNIGTLPIVDADKLQMRQLFQNLISNALKFHKDNTPPIVKINTENTQNGTYKITVEDNGVGFHEKYLDRIFKPFHRLHGRNEFEGTGMGTAICMRIVKRHGGTLTAKSKIGEGSTFIITLPEKQEEFE